MYKKTSKKLEVFNQNELTSYPIPERRPEPTTEAKKSNSPILPQPRDFYTLMKIKNMDERGQYMILADCTSRFSKIITGWLNALEIADINTYLTSQDFAINF